jgi:ADP-ribose pyrophosphatase YjhB (NUDIX family)
VVTPVSTDAVDARLYPSRPFLAVSLAVFRGDRVLLIARRRPPFENVHTLPGGHVELGETLEAACGRELEEETGVRADRPIFNTCVQVLDRDAEGRVRRHVVIATFAARWRSGEGAPSDEAAAVLWAVPDALARLTVTPGLLDVIARARGLIGERE